MSSLVIANRNSFRKYLHLPLCREAERSWRTGPPGQLKLVKEHVPGTIQSSGNLGEQAQLAGGASKV